MAKPTIEVEVHRSTVQKRVVAVDVSSPIDYDAVCRKAIEDSAGGSVGWVTCSITTSVTVNEAK